MNFQFDLRDERDAKDLLLEFLIDVREFFRELVWKRAYRFNIRFVGQSLKLLDTVLHTEFDDQFEDALSGLAKVSRRRLRLAGLDGISLRTKLHILREWAQIAREGSAAALQRVLQNINSILGSFVWATRTGEAIKEFKEMIENAIVSFGPPDGEQNVER